jgi:hypothetical protein
MPLEVSSGPSCVECLVAMKHRLWMRQVKNDGQLEDARNGLLVSVDHKRSPETFCFKTLGTSVLMLSLCNIERLRQLTHRKQINKATARLHDSKMNGPLTTGRIACRVIADFKSTISWVDDAIGCMVLGNLNGPVGS